MRREELEKEDLEVPKKVLKVPILIIHEQYFKRTLL